MAILGTLFSWMIGELVFDGKNDPLPFDVAYKITTPNGTIGCLTQSDFKEIAAASANKNFALMKKMTDLGLCDYFAQGTEIFLQKNICSAASKDDEIFVAMMKKSKQKFYMTCSVIR